MNTNTPAPVTSDDFSTFAQITDPNLVLGLALGMEIETRSRSYYQSVAQHMAADKRLILKFLANEELDHYKTLRAFQTALQQQNNWVELTPQQRRRFRLPRLYLGKRSPPFIPDDATETDIILAAMNAEKKAEQFYLRVGSKVKDVKTQLFFKALARFERGHYNVLKGLL
jgi:rubrerythrin